VLNSVITQLSWQLTVDTSYGGVTNMKYKF